MPLEKSNLPLLDSLPHDPNKPIYGRSTRRPAVEYLGLLQCGGGGDGLPVAT